MTITEALAEIKTLAKRIEKKQQFVKDYLYRHNRIRDPLESDGGSRKAVDETLQAIYDMQTRIVKIRVAVARVNQATSLTVCGVTQTIKEWLIWRREIMPEVRGFWASVRKIVVEVRKQATEKGIHTLDSDEAGPDDMIINISEAELAKQIEMIEEIEGTLDGQLSLLNATTHIEIA